MTEKYTFIIPVYNVEKYLSQCLDSILCQTFKDYRIILVDDGSKDSSGAICDEYAAKHKCIDVVHKPNGGLSSARNTGLLMAETEYVIFIDSDDYWNSPDGLSEIDALILNTSTDIVCFASQNYYEDTGASSSDRYNYPDAMNEMTPIESVQYQISHDLFNVSAVKKVYRRSFLVDNQLFFKEGIKSEDIEFALRMLNLKPNYRFLNEKLYTYRHRQGSITKTIDDNHINDYTDIIRTFSSYVFYDEIKEYALSYVAYQYALLVAYITNLNVGNKKERLHDLKNYSYLLGYTKYPRVKAISRVYKFFGFNLTRWLLGLYLKGRL